MEVIESWGRPSPTALCELWLLEACLDEPYPSVGAMVQTGAELTPGALFCLVDFVSSIGSGQEQSGVLQQMAWQVEALGLHKKATANLYPTHEQASPLAAAFFYMDS
jgi:hypothetical protein